MAGGVKPKKEKEPGGLVQTDKTAELYKKLRRNPRLWRRDWQK
jgi:hypothetical protein